MPAELLAGPLGIACTFSNGRSRRWLISGDAGKSRLAADLLAGLAELVYPHGTVDSAKTIECYLVGLRDMAAFMAARGVVGGATALTRAVLVEYWMQAGPMRETWTRRMLAGYHAAAGVLDPAVLALTTGRHFTPQSRSTPLTPYTEQEWEKLQQEFRRVTDEAFNVHRHALAGAKSGCDPRDGGWNEDNLRHLLGRIGPCTAARVDAHLGKKPGWVVYHGGVRATCDELFPSATVAMAYRLLFGTVSGIVPDGVADLGVGDIEWAGDATVLLGYVKGRTAAESVTLPRRAVRLLEQWLEHSALLRRHAPPEVTDRLWLHYNYSGSPRWPATIARGIQAAVVKKWDLPPVDQRRIRTTYLSLRDRGSWHGSARSLIDPNHSPAVEADHYLTAATPAQLEAVETIIEQAQADMVRRAATPVVVTGIELAGLARDFPAMVQRLGLEATEAGEIVSGVQDVFVAACSDPLSGLHGPKGQNCPARVWVCLLCPLAIFTPRHAANLLRMRSFFSRKWRAMPSAQFMATFGPYQARIEQVLQAYPATTLAGAAAGLGEGSDDDLPLRPEERS